MNLITGEELNAVWELKKKLDREQRRRADLEIFAQSTTQVLDGMPHGKPLTFKVERIATLIMECEDGIKSLAEQIIQRKFDLLTRIQTFHLSELQERVLSYHYVSCLRFKEIAKLMCFTKDYICRLHGQALLRLGLNTREMRKIKKAATDCDISIGVN